MQSPFISRRNARRLAIKNVKEHADTINVALCEGQRVLNIAVGLVDALAQIIQQAGGWRTVVKVRGEAQGTVVVVPDPTVKRDAVADSPIYSYEDVRRRSVEYVAKSAIEINAALEKGERAFQRYVGIADDIVAGLNAPIDGEPSGWKAREKERNDAFAIILVDEDLDDAVTAS